jgi:microcystin-dependent protein
VGDTGPRGNTGVQGSTGIIGDTGPQGKTGVRGETGVVGAPGATGSVGYTGPRGETGVRGATGLVGETGLQGRTGQRGETGEKGAQGSPGDTGVQGLTGLIGDTLAHHIQLSTGGWVRAGGSTAGVLFGETGGAFGLWGRGDNATQFEVSALDGRAYFGERAVTMDRDGLVLIADTGYADKRSIRWVSGSSTMGYVRAKAPVGGSYLTLESQGITGSASYCEVIANGFTGQPCAAVLKAAWSGGGSSPAEIVTYVDGYGATRMDLRSSTVAVVGGLACTPYDDEVGLGDGIIWGREGIAAGESQKVWKLGGYTGSAALATGYTWIEINGTLYKILDRDSADARYAAFPAGVMTAFGGASPPSGWLLCDGSAVSRSTYAALFAAIGTTYGVGDGSTTFNLPELRQKFLRGKGASDTLGAAGGAATHTHAAHGALSHSGAAVADHAALGHTGAAVTAHSTASSKFGTAAGTVVTTATHTVTQPAQHAAQAHTVTQPSAHAAQAHDTPNSEPPYVNVNWIIKV